MMLLLSIRHEFIRSIPRVLEPGVLYISMEFATAAHSCCCGCGEQVITPLTPTDWRMTFDGETVSLHPSIGNWNQKCRSHYIIRQGKVIEASPWSDKQVEDERHRDRKAKASFFAEMNEAHETEENITDESFVTSYSEGFWSNLLRQLRITKRT